MSDVAPPDMSAWWDPAATKSAVLAQLRLSDTDVDEGRIEALIPAAGRLINDHLDHVAPVVANPLLQNALERVTIDLYLQRTAISTPGAQILDVGLSGDVEALLMPDKEREGIS